jgi:hypothetical protein
MKLQLTNGYDPDFSHIGRILKYLVSRNSNRRILRSEMVKDLGIPNKQIENYSSMMVGFGLFFPKSTKPTLTGKYISKFDPYFDRIESLWLIHYLVSSEPEWVIWNRISNLVFPNLDDFTADQVKGTFFQDLLNKYSEYTIQKKLPGEIKAVLTAYTQTELSRLNLLTQIDANFIKGFPIEVPLMAFLYILYYYRNKMFPGSSALDINEITYPENSPGRLLQCSQPKLREYLQALQAKGFVRVERNANLDQIRFNDDTNEENILPLIYGGTYAP